MNHRSVNTFFLHLAKCLKEQGVTNHAVRQGFKQANLSMKQALPEPKEVELLTNGLAVAYLNLE